MTDREFVRHTVATLAYRAAKTMRGAPDSFAHFRAGGIGKPPLEILAHMGDLVDWALTLVQGSPRWRDSTPRDWAAERDRFFSALKAFDDYLASGAPVSALDRCFQGPIADALTHTGQLAMLRRLSGSPMKGESYNRADIAVGRVGLEQIPPDPKLEFD